MSIILITHHDENIYNISENVESGPKALSSYKRKLKRAPREVTFYNKCLVKPHATMGVAEGTPPDPCDFLKKHSGKPLHPKCEIEKGDKHHCPRKEKVFPSKEEMLKYNEAKAAAARVEKNFVVRNIRTVLKMKPKEPDKKTVVEKHGETKFLVQGLEPIYIKSEVFGKTPKYLQHMIREQQKAYQMKKDRSGVEQPKCRYITRDEREKLLNGLKYNWEKLQKQYQGLPILTDTIPKKMRKSKLEEELKQLEKDIVLVERHSYIYVYDNDNEAS